MDKLQKSESEVEARAILSLSKRRSIGLALLTGMAASGLSTLLYFLMKPTVSRLQMLFMYGLQMAAVTTLFGWQMWRRFRRRGAGCGESKPEPPNDARGV